MFLTMANQALLYRGPASLVELSRHLRPLAEADDGSWAVIAHRLECVERMTS